jgi:hypothetical protein
MDWDENGLSVVERGVLSLPSRYRLAARIMATIGFCAAVLMVCYQLPVNWVCLTGHSFAHLPSYPTLEGLVVPHR